MKENSDLPLFVAKWLRAWQEFQRLPSPRNDIDYMKKNCKKGQECDISKNLEEEF